MTKTVQEIIDQAGYLKAEIAELEAKEAQLRNLLCELAPGAYEGNVFRLTVSKSTRSMLDMTAVREHLSPQFIRAHTCVTDVRTLRFAARANRNVEAT